MKLDVDRLIDEAPISALQYRVFLFCAVVALLDAVDSVSIGLAGPLWAGTQPGRENHSRDPSGD